jgi:PDZ domain-containing protein
VSSHDGESLETAEVSPETAAFGQDDVSVLGEEPPSRKWSRRRWKVITIVAVVLAAIILASSLISLPYYAITPGAAQSVLPLIGVPPAHAQNHNGSIDLVDVEVTPLRLIDWLYFKLDPNATLYSSAAIQGPETNAQYNIEGVLDMADAQQAATVVALTQLGYHVTVIPNGSLVYALDPGSPADAGLQVGDVIIGIGSQAVNSPTALSTALFPYKVGESVTIRYRPFQSSAPKTATIQTGAWRWMGTGSNQQLTCVSAAAKSTLPIAKLYDDKGALYLPTKQHPGAATACLGVLDAEPSYHVVLPFQVNLNSEGIVGPSAGLAFTLGLMQKLDAGNLTGGLKVAATGTISVTGQIGAIGGIQQKTIAVRSSGASIFLVPPDNYAIAKKYAGSTLKVFAVSTISQALSVLERYGGKVVMVTGS